MENLLETYAFILILIFRAKYTNMSGSWLAGRHLHKKKDNDLDFLQFAVETSYTKMRTSCFESQ